MRKPMLPDVVLVAAACCPLAAWGAEERLLAAFEPCSRSSVLEEIDSRDPQQLLSILERAAKVENAGFVLWRIEPESSAPSYLFGTIHVVDAYLQTLTPAVQAAIAGSQSVVLESTEPDLQSLHRLAAVGGDLMADKSGQSSHRLDPDQLAKLEHELEIAGLPTYWASSLRPWALTLLLGRSDCQEYRLRNGQKSLDMLVATEARARGIQLVGLESRVEQYQSLAGIPEDLQLVWLKSTIALAGRGDEIAETIGELYRFRRIAALWEITNELTPDEGLDNATLSGLRNRLVDVRNQRMLERARPLVKRGGAFIAVGALHLVGPNGLVALLRGDGFKITPIE